MELLPRSVATGHAQRAHTYELAAFHDGAALVYLWPKLVLPREIRAAWTPVIVAAIDAVEDS